MDSSKDNKLSENTSGKDEISVTDTPKKGRVADSCRWTGSAPGKLRASGYQFIETIEKNFNKQWKIGIHWLTALKSGLAEPFDEPAIKIFNSSQAKFIPICIDANHLESWDQENFEILVICPVPPK